MHFQPGCSIFDDHFRGLGAANLFLFSIRGLSSLYADFLLNPHILLTTSRSLLQSDVIDVLGTYNSGAERSSLVTGGRGILKEQPSPGSSSSPAHTEKQALYEDEREQDE
jgi:hypothetical protein